MKCGDVVRNGWAGERNPGKFFVYIGRSGKYAKGIAFNGKGNLQWNEYYSDSLKTDMYQVVGHVPIREIIKQALREAFDKEETANGK